MQPYELTIVLFSEIKSLHPENVIKIMGYLLIQDIAEKDLIRLVYGPETKIQLVLSSNKSSAYSTPTVLNPITNHRHSQWRSGTLNDEAMSEVQRWCLEMRKDKEEEGAYVKTKSHIV